MKSLEGVGIFLAKKWVYKISDISRLSNIIIVMKVLVQFIISVISSPTVWFRWAVSMFLES